jgi:TATA-binding protein-associated factor Taf7
MDRRQQELMRRRAQTPGLVAPGQEEQEQDQEEQGQEQEEQGQEQEEETKTEDGCECPSCQLRLIREEAMELLLGSSRRVNVLLLSALQNACLPDCQGR